jgi:hypothetical protein
MTGSAPADPLPPDNPQPGNSSEMTYVARDHGDILSERDRSNHGVTRTDRSAAPIKRTHDLTVGRGGAIVERQGSEWCAE